MSRGIFSLNESYNEQISGDWSTASDVWLIGSPVTVGESPFGYCISGVNPSYTSPVSTVQRIDYNNDTATASIRGPLGQGRFKVSAVSSLTHGYAVGGKIGNPVTQIS